MFCCFELLKKFLCIEPDQKNQEIITDMIQTCRQIQNIYKNPDVKLISFIEAQYDAPSPYVIPQANDSYKVLEIYAPSNDT